MSVIRLTSVNLDLPVGVKSLKSLFTRKPAPASDPGGGHRVQGEVCKVLQDINLEINSGEKVGLIGVNGAGKSSLLRVLAGIYAPTEGAYEAQGKISTLFTATVGMQNNASGRENIFLSARTLGLSRAQIAAVRDDIIEFAELGEFIDLPVRLYSAGMKMRLGFAIATSIKPEILLIDEVFGAGDVRFRKRANERIKTIIEGAGLLVLATHSEAAIKNFCERVIWLDQGEIRFDGATEEGLERFRNAGKTA